MANNPITPSASSYVNGTVIDASYMNDLASALNRALGFRTQATANSTLTLVLADLEYQEFTGTTAGQIVQMPVTSTLGIGMAWIIANKSTQTIAVNSSGGNLIYTVPAGATATITCNAITGTTAASWSFDWSGAAAAPSGGGMTPLSTTTLSGATTTISGINQTYRKLVAYIYGMTNATADGIFRIAANGVTNNAAGVQIQRDNTIPSVVANPANGYINTGIALARAFSANELTLEIDDYANASGLSPYTFKGYVRETTPQDFNLLQAGCATQNTPAALTSLVFSNTGGDFSTGTVLLFGVK